MRLQRQSSGQIITLTQSTYLDRGGEGEVHKIGGDLVAKTYHKPTEARGRKLAAMVANPPEDPMRGSGHITIAWPVDILLTTDSTQAAAGFLMPLVTGMASLDKLYIPKSRRQHYPLFNWHYLLRTARNLAAAVKAIHDRGYVIGDINESNIRVADTALVTLVDTDSFQVREPLTGVVHRCPVGKAEFIPPELQGKSLRDVDREPASDLFALAVLIFQLLMEGTHPFAGVYSGAGEAPAIEGRIAAGHFPHCTDKKSPYRPSPTAPPFEILHPELRRLFLRCFADGHGNPGARPDAAAWLAALEQAEDLSVCTTNEQHYYGKHLASCPWCERAALLGGHDPFPSRQSVKSGSHLPKAKVKQKPLPPVYNPGISRSTVGALAAQRLPTYVPQSPSGHSPAASHTPPAFLANAAATGHPLPILYMLERRARRRRRMGLVIGGLATVFLLIGGLSATGRLPGFSHSVTAPVAYERVTKPTHVPYKTKTVRSSALPAGTRRVSQEGVDGITSVVYEVTSRNGVKLSSRVVDKTVKRAPVTEIILIGDADSGSSSRHSTGPARGLPIHHARMQHAAHSKPKMGSKTVHANSDDLHSESTIGSSLH